MKKLISRKIIILVSALLTSFIFIQLLTAYDLVPFIPHLTLVIVLIIAYDVSRQSVRNHRVRRHRQQQKIDAIREYYQYERMVEPPEMNN